MKKLLLSLCVALLPLAAVAHTRVFLGIGGGLAVPGGYGYGYYGPAFGFAVGGRHFGFSYSGPLPGFYYPPSPAYYYSPPPPPPAVVAPPPPPEINRDDGCYWRDGVQYCYEN